MYVGFVKTYSYGLISPFHCFTSGLWLLQWVSDVDVRVPLAEQRCGDAVDEQLPSDETHADQPQSVHSYLSWLRAVFLGYWLSFLAPCLSFSRSFSSLSFFLSAFFSSCSSLLFCLYCLRKLQQSLCVCVCEGGREREIVWMFVCVCVCACRQVVRKSRCHLL